MSRLYVRGASRDAGKEYVPARSVTTVMLTVLPPPLARTRTPSIGPVFAELTWPARASGAGWWVLAADEPAKTTPKANTHNIILSIIHFLESGYQPTGNINLRTKEYNPRTPSAAGCPLSRYEPLCTPPAHPGSLRHGFVESTKPVHSVTCSLCGLSGVQRTPTVWHFSCQIYMSG